MNNIDILEEFLKIKINSYAIKFVNISYPELQQAISTLIAENKELKEERDIYRSQLNSAFSNGFIPKSKVEEILQKYKYTELGDDYKIIQFYKEMQSLLGKE